MSIISAAAVAVAAIGAFTVLKLNGSNKVSGGNLYINSSSDSIEANGRKFSLPD